ncbi:DNA polymerase III subunit delta [Kineothrix sp. MB12-C1]|uniref:DNA polymerase III subunit delta n=1 Tax=Kineothrix sp. MB12-C1 TaxID=3070215 RepID=UPI0027D2466B|nr:DNA polymerase III subunit delta [Kineothrix sp. MB12-C1]WMC92012.1 DNA polymerase III subunit delta [Kineothrix sp. MB12-C1]
MQRINEDIKEGQFKNIYLLYGEESYLRKQYRDRLKNALMSEEDTMNYNYFEGKDISAGSVIDLAETMPFFADRRVIIIENSGLFKHGGEQIAEYLNEPAQTAYIVFVEAEVDKRSKLFKTVSSKGTAVEFPAQTEATLQKWILGMIKKEDKKISEPALRYFMEKTGTDMENIRKELEKLMCYCMEKEAVTEQDIEDICTHRVSNHIFDMVNAIADKKQREALNLYYDLLALKEPPMRILFLIARQYNMLLQVKEMKGKGYDNKKIGGKAGLLPFIAGKYVTQSAKFRLSDLRSALEACVEAEEAVKTGKINDMMSVELLIVKYSAS